MVKRREPKPASSSQPTQSQIEAFASEADGGAKIIIQAKDLNPKLIVYGVLTMAPTNPSIHESDEASFNMAHLITLSFVDSHFSFAFSFMRFIRCFSLSFMHISATLLVLIVCFLVPYWCKNGTVLVFKWCR